MSGPWEKFQGEPTAKMPWEQFGGGNADDEQIKKMYTTLQKIGLQKVPETPEEKAAFLKAREEQDKAAKDAMTRGWGTGIPKAANQVGGAITDALAGKVSPETAAALGTGGNFLTNAIPTLLSSFSPAGPAKSLLEKPANWFMQSAVKPAQDDRLSGAAGKAFRTMYEEGINATRGGMDKAADKIGKLHTGVEDTIAASNATVPVGPMGQKYLEQYEKALTQANPNADLDAVKGVWGEFVNSPLAKNQDELPVQIAHLIKRGTQQSVGSKSYGELGSSSVEAQKGLARYLREGVGEAVPSVLEPLKRESGLMNVLDVARNRALLNANSNPLSLGALRIGDNPLSTAAFMADKSALLKSLAARGLFGAGRPELALPGVLAGSDLLGILQGQQ